MDALTQRLQREAERIASRHQPPAFYINFKAEMALARKLYFHHPLVILLREWVQPRLQEDLGHGLYHSMKVSLDSATLICVELGSSPVEREQLEEIMVLGILAGLLHDMYRGEAEHAKVGAREAAKILMGYPLSEEEISCICQAIRNHEAFTPPLPCGRPLSQLVSDCLYDADKFRWGPDTFTHTLWYMIARQGLSPQELIERFPWGMKGVARIRDTFRTATGRQFGPDIIEAGISIGREIYHYLLQHFGGDENEK